MTNKDKWAAWSRKLGEFEKDSTLTQGKRMMEALAAVDIMLYTKILDTDYDCSEDDSYCHNFMQKLVESWRD